MNRFEGKTIWITGAANGIGLATATEFAREGADVIATDLTQSALDAAFSDCQKEGLSITTAVQDVTDQQRWNELSAEILSNQGQLDVLVNNAGIAEFAKVTETSLEQWRRIHRVNLEGVFFGIQTGIDAMKDKGGTIINVASIASNVAEPTLAAYSSTKGAVSMLTKTSAVECARDGIPVRINSIHPGYTNTPLVANALETLGEQAAVFAASVAQAIPIGSLAEPINIAKPLLFLASDDASYMVGAELVVDGGYTAV